MNTTGMIFKGPEVIALLDGRKTQHRTVVKLPKQACIGKNGEGLKAIVPAVDGKHFITQLRVSDSLRGVETHINGASFKCPHPVGSVLFVKETFWLPPEITPHMRRQGADTWPKVFYEADSDIHDQGTFIEFGWKKKPSTQMPPWASRLWLRVEKVRCEKLGSITDEDCVAEGTPNDALVHYYCDEGDPDDPNDFGTHRCNWRYAYSRLWASIHGEGSWDLNPWVWVYDFKRIGKPVMPKEVHPGIVAGVFHVAEGRSLEPREIVDPPSPRLRRDS